MSIFVGYDPKERLAFNVCRYSIMQVSKLIVYRVFSETIPYYYRNFGEPQSTDFTFTRFLVPHMCNFEGYSIFCDSDFLFLDDPQKLLDIAKANPSKAVHVVKHPNYVPKSDLKMDGKPQHRAPRKNWASLMVFNNSHPSTKRLTLDYINNHPKGRDFHDMTWVDDDDIGSLPLEWNCLDGYYDLENPHAIHYTDGGPWHGKEFTNTQYSKLWQDMHWKFQCSQ